MLKEFFQILTNGRTMTGALGADQVLLKKAVGNPDSEVKCRFMANGHTYADIPLKEVEQTANGFSGTVVFENKKAKVGIVCGENHSKTFSAKIPKATDTPLPAPVDGVVAVVGCL